MSTARANPNIEIEWNAHVHTCAFHLYVSQKSDSDCETLGNIYPWSKELGLSSDTDVQHRLSVNAGGHISRILTSWIASRHDWHHLCNSVSPVWYLGDTGLDIIAFWVDCNRQLELGYKSSRTREDFWNNTNSMVARSLWVWTTTVGTRLVKMLLWICF